MPSIGTLDGLFELAAADWIYTPLPPVKGGGHAPHVVSRTINVFAQVQAVTAGVFGQEGGETNDLTLNYLPPATYHVKGGLAEVPASFYGNATVPFEPGNLTVSISQSADFGGYGVVINNRGYMTSFSVPAPGGQPEGPAAALVGITFSGQGEYRGMLAQFNITLNQYSFQLTLT